MSQSTEDVLPPYFNISPDEALAELGAPVGRRGLRRDRPALRRGPAGPGQPRPCRRRRAPAAAVLDLGDHPLPDPGGARAFPPGAARQPRPAPGPHRDRRAARSGSPSTRCCGCARISPPKAAAPRSTGPGARAGLPAKIVAVANFKGGVGKTSTAAHLAMSAALDGYRVLVIDLDSQGSMTSMFGGKVASEWDTVFPLIARDYALGLQAENRRRAERGEAPAAARGHAGRGADPHRAGRDPEDPLAEHRPDRRAAEPLLGRVPDPGLADGAARLEALGGAGAGAGARPRARRPTTSSSSTPRRRSATSRSTA